MPEGDTIHKLAAAIGPLLQGRALRQLALREGGSVAGLAGQRVSGVKAVGKHLLIATEEAWVVRTHLGMHGSWHRYRPDEPWQRSPRTASLVLSTADDVLVCFRAKQVEIFRATALADHPVLSKLGPDLLAAEVDFDEVRARARTVHPGRAIGEVLLDQTVAAGLGNVYKSELLFLCRIHPGTPVAAVDEAAVEALFRLGRRLLQRNLGPGKRVTTRLAGLDREEVGQELPEVRPPAALWVYRRVGRPCFLCQTAIESDRQGDLARVTYWCPSCQVDTR